MILYSPGFCSIPEMTNFGWGGAGTFRRGPVVTGESKNSIIFKIFDGRVATILMIPHNLGFYSIREMTDSGVGVGGSGTLRRGPGVAPFNF